MYCISIGTVLHIEGEIVLLQGLGLERNKNPIQQRCICITLGWKVKKKKSQLIKIDEYKIEIFKNTINNGTNYYASGIIFTLLLVFSSF